MWTEELERRARQLWLEGYTTKEIAEELGHGITRNAVVGKIHRARKLHIINGARMKEPPAPPPPKPFWPKRLPGSGTVTIFELTDVMCRWPIGDPSEPDFAFCGARKIDGHSYCAYHTRIGYIRRS